MLLPLTCLEKAGATPRWRGGWLRRAERSSRTRGYLGAVVLPRRHHIRSFMLATTTDKSRITVIYKSISSTRACTLLLSRAAESPPLTGRRAKFVEFIPFLIRHDRWILAFVLIICIHCSTCSGPRCGRETQDFLF